MPSSSSSSQPDNATPRAPLKPPAVYRVDGHLVGISVIDVLPHCVSSVYFIWDPDWAWASLGKLSALREVAMAREMAEAGAQGMGWLYMGEWNDLR
jgi:arginine-tRNA-protein transferase